MNSGADCYMTDFEDSLTPTFENLIQGQLNLKDAINKKIDFKDQKSGKEYKLNEKEKDTIKCINRYNDIIKNSKDELSPAIICNYLYDLVKTFNSLYQNHNILSAETPDSIVST